MPTDNNLRIHLDDDSMKLSQNIKDSPKKLHRKRLSKMTFEEEK